MNENKNTETAPRDYSALRRRYRSHSDRYGVTGASCPECYYPYGKHSRRCSKAV